MRYLESNHNDYGMKHRRKHYLTKIMDVFYEDEYCKRADLISLLDISADTIEEIIGDDRDLFSLSNAIKIVKQVIINKNQ